MLKTIVKHPGMNRRIKQLIYEIRTTKRLLMPTFGNKELRRNYHLVT